MAAAMAVDVRDEEVVAPSLRKAVVDINRARGSPRWTPAETAEVCVQVDVILEKRGICSSNAFRQKRDSMQFVQAWANACEFEWY